MLTKSLWIESAPLIKFLLSIFFHFHTQYVFPRYLFKSQYIVNISAHIYWALISENLCTFNFLSWLRTGFNLSKVLCMGGNYNYNSTALHIENNKTFALIFMQLSIQHVIVIITSTCAVYLSKWHHSQPRLGTRKIYTSRKFSE